MISLWDVADSGKAYFFHRDGSGKALLFHRDDLEKTVFFHRGNCYFPIGMT